MLDAAAPTSRDVTAAAFRVGVTDQHPPASRRERGERSAPSFCPRQRGRSASRALLLSAPTYAKRGGLRQRVMRSRP